MAKKKINKKGNARRKSKTRGKKPLFGNLSLVLICTLVAFVIVGVIFYLAAQKLWQDSTPVKDKSLPLEVQQGFGVINEIVKQELDRIGISASDYRRQEMVPVTIGGVKWNMVQIEIDLPGEISLKDAAETFLNRMQGMEDQVDFYLEYPDPSSLELTWKIYNYPTHKLIFREAESVTGEEGGIGGVRAQIAIVIDDIGFKRSVAKEFLALPAPVTFSILSQSPFGAELAREALDAGREIILHLPMEPHNQDYLDQKSMKFLTLDLNEAEIVDIVEQDIEEIPGVVGANNHMGSRFTENARHMQMVLGVLEEHDLFFLDSRTSSETVAYDVARQMGIPAAKRDIFLDNIRDSKEIDQQLQFLVDIALKNGEAIAIGHPHYTTLTALQKFLLQTDSLGIKIVPLSQLVH